MSAPERFFLLVGAPKCGTTALAGWMTARPDIRMTVHKEPRFFTDFATVPWAGPDGDRFAKSMITDEADYLAAFGDCTSETWAIDASTDYLWCEASAGLIRDWADRFQVKIACILRDPVERAVSEYRHTIRDLLQRDSFLASLEKEEERFRAHWHPLFYHTRRSRYYDRVKAYRDLFGADFLLLDYAELKEPDVLGRKIEAFLDLPPRDLPPPERVNVGAEYRSRLAAGLLKARRARAAARALVPKPLRAPIRRLATRLNQAPEAYQATARELDYLATALAEDIAKCRADPDIPTESWQSR